MFINKIQNHVAKQILCRIYAINMAMTTGCKFEYAATIVEAANWASKTMQSDKLTLYEKGYCAVHSFWIYSRNKCEAKEMRNFVRYDSDKGIYVTISAESALYKVWRKMRNNRQ